MESTMMRSFYHAANLRALFHEGGPCQLESLRSSFREAFESNDRGSLYNDIRAFEANEIGIDRGDIQINLANASMTPIPPHISEQLPAKPLMGYLLPRIQVQGAFISTSRASRRDCHIYFYDADGTCVPCTIKTIFAYKSRNVENGGLSYGLEVDAFDKVTGVNEIADDCYRRWEIIAGALYRCNSPRIIELKDLAWQAIRREHVAEDRHYRHFMPCTKVSRQTTNFEERVYLSSKM